MSRSLTDPSKIEINTNKSTDNTKVNKNDKDPTKKDEHIVRRRERSPGQQEFIENRQKHLQMRKALISKMQQKRNLSFRNNNGKFFTQRRIRQFSPKQTKKLTTNQNTSSENLHKLNKPLSITEKFIHQTKWLQKKKHNEIAELELAIKEGRSLTTDDMPVNDTGKSSQILEMEKELMAERERIHFLKLQVEADLNRETENAAKIVHENAYVKPNLMRTPSIQSRSPTFRNERQLYIGHGFRKNVQRRSRFSKSMANLQDQKRRQRDLSQQPQYQQDFEKDNSPLNDHKNKIFKLLEDDYNKRQPSKYNEKVRNAFQNRDNRDRNNTSKSFPRNFHDIDDQQSSMRSPSSNRRLDRNNDYTTKSTHDGYRSSVSVERRIENKANLSTTSKLITTYSKEDEMEMKFIGGGMFDKHILHIQNEFVDRFGLLQQSPMETDRHEEKYIEKSEKNVKKKHYGHNEYNDNHTVPRNRTHENRYSSRLQHIFDDDLPDRNQEVDYEGRKMNKDFDIQPHRSTNYLNREDVCRDNDQKPESDDIDYNTNFRELTDKSYIRQSRSTERNWHTERNNRPYNPFTSNNNADDETFTRKKSTDRSNNRYHSSTNLSDRRSVDIILQKPATATGFNEISGKNVHISDYRSHQNRHIINDGEDNDDRFTQRSNRDNKINEFFNDRNQNIDARQYIIEKEMHKFNERTRSSARSSNTDFVSKRINDRHEHSTVSSNWSNKNRDDFSLSFNELNSMHNSYDEINDEKFTADDDNNDEVTRGRRMNTSRKQFYHNVDDDKRNHMEKCNERRYDHPTNQQRYRIRNQHRGEVYDANERLLSIREMSKNQFKNNNGRAHDKKRFLSHKRNNNDGGRTNDSRMVTIQEKRNSYFHGN